MLKKIVLSLLIVFPAWADEPGNYADRPEVRQFAEEFVEAHGTFTVDELLALFARAEYKQRIIDAMSRPAEKTLNWDRYQDIFLTRRRVTEGRQFMIRYREALDDAREKFGVPPAVVASVIGVETMYGGNRGSHRVIDALSTLAFDYPPRARFFRGELEAFLLLAKEEEQDAMELKGSYAGAMGYGQFIPTSYRRYAVDFDGDGIRDIWNNPVDAIGSVANYLYEHGWRANDDIVLRVQISGDEVDELFGDQLKPSLTMSAFLDHGIGTDIDLSPDEKVSPLRFMGKQGEEHWLGLNNFYVITRYNHSKLYAMAVYQLSERLRPRQLAENP